MRFNEAYIQFSKMWESKLRFYHTKENHLDKILPFCNTVELKYFALFHDIMYDPYSKTNEEESITFFKENASRFEDLYNIELVIEMILATKTHEHSDNSQINKAIEIDMAILASSFGDLLTYEYGIFKEFQRTDISIYIEKRIEFLSQYKHIGHINDLIEYINNRNYSIGLYTISHDSFDLRNLDILKKAEALFDKVVIIRETSTEKIEHKNPILNSLPNQIIEWSGSISDLFIDKKIKKTLIREIKNEDDIVSEKNYMECVHKIDRTIPFIYLFSDHDI